MRIKSAALLGALAAGALILGGCSSPAGSSEPVSETDNNDGPTRGGSATIAIVPLQGIDPLIAQAPADVQVTSAIYETLVTIDEDRNLVPGLATSWESSDGQNWTFTLREGVVFHDGTPFNADAVVANLDRAKAATNCTPCAGLAAVQYTAEDERTVAFSLAAPDAAFPASLVDSYGYMASPAAIAEYGDQLSAHPTGTGAFQVKSIDEQGVILNRFEDYWDSEKPYLDTLNYRILADPQSQITALQSGDVDLIFNATGDQTVQAQSVANTEITTAAGLGILVVYLNNSQAPFDDPRAREAVIRATDREALLKITNPLGDGKVVDGPWGSGMPVMLAAAESDEYPTYDPDAAKALVDELGGLSFTFETYNFGTYGKIAQALESMWAESGIKAEINLVDLSTLISDTVAGSHQAAMSTWTGKPDPGLSAARVVWGGIPNPVGAHDATIDGYLAEGYATLDDAKRVEIYQDLVDYMAEQSNALWLSELRSSAISNSATVGGVQVLANTQIVPKALYAKK